MSRNRYVGDYRLVDSIDEAGRIRTDYEYIGAAYAFASGAKEARRWLIRVFVACGVGWLALVGALVPVSRAARTLYAVLPFAFAALPLGLMTTMVARALRAGQKLEHRHADQLANRCPACSFLTMLLSGIALIGEGVNLVRGAGLLPGDIVFAVGAALLFAAGLHNHRLWRRVRCVETPPSAERSER